MEELLDAVAAVVSQLPPEKLRAIANRLRGTDPDKAVGALSGVLNTPASAAVVDRLVDTWRAHDVSPDELASMLLAAGHVLTQVMRRQSTELVWTGPTTPVVSARRTEQALLQVINAAEHTLFMTSFVAYDVSTIVRALNAAADRGVMVSMLLELSRKHGGSINFDVIGKMRTLVSGAQLYAWHDKTALFLEGRVHAKVAVADGRVCFITSANLTGYAMDRNMEAGVLITGGHIPRLLNDHLQALVTLNVIAPV